MPNAANMSVSSTPSKRQRDGTLGEPEGKAKSQKRSHSENESLKPSSNGVNFRMLCPASKVGGFFGKDGSLAAEIERQTGTKLIAEDLIPGCDERVVVISFDDKEENADEKNDEENGRGKDVEGNECLSDEDSDSEKGGLSVQTGLLLFFDRMAEGVTEKDGTNKNKKKSPSAFVLRVLVPSTQVGCILGKGGSVIKQMASASGAQIRIIPRDKIPSCVSDLNELVQITGAVNAVRKALQSVSSQILGIPSGGPGSLPSHPTPTPSNLHGQQHPRLEGFPPPTIYSGGTREVDYRSVVPRFGEGGGIPGRTRPAQEILSFRLLCRADRIGGVIGKSGQVIKTVQQDTGCDVKVLEAVPGSEDHVVIISGPVHPDDRISAVQDAVLRVQARISRDGSEINEQGAIARLLVSSVQIGCLLGKGGSAIAELRKFSRAHIHVLPKDQIPKCASEDEEVVQMNGEFEAVQEALVQITTRLQHFFFRDAFPLFGLPPNPSFLDRPPYPPFFGRRELSPPRMYPNHGIHPFHKFDPFGMPPPHVGFHPRDDHGHLMRDIHRFGGPFHISDRRHWGTQGLLEGDGASLPELDRGDHTEAITSTTVEVVVPSSVVPEIYGEDDECLKQIREISDAKITITEPKLGAEETVIIIYGTPEQTHAAQSLIQAFVISATESS